MSDKGPPGSGWICGKLSTRPAPTEQRFGVGGGGGLGRVG